ncbi:hypothetical protein F5878DRAFT_608629 [Lentinula raphanica]|uniref:NAD(P)-binding protein n=1 Tax=Lentinula raphanica TaxID=153919 RepID=A0AA38UI54_9AGAR|nr:hypothetical protein F5878DRAFT_608629 [Lentinula raphanica]
MIGTPSYEKTEDGYATILQTNDIGPSLHTLLLLPYLVKTAEEHNTKPRIVIVSSYVHYWAMGDKGRTLTNQPNIIDAMSSVDYYFNKKLPVDQHYFDSKLLNVFFVRALQAPPREIPRYSRQRCEPGILLRGFRSDFKGIRALLDHLMERLLAMTTEEGGRQIVWAAVGGVEEEERLKGGYVSFGEVVEPSDFSISREGQELEEKYWTQQLDILKGVDPRVKQIVDQYLYVKGKVVHVYMCS